MERCPESKKTIEVKKTSAFHRAWWNYTDKFIKEESYGQKQFLYLSRRFAEDLIRQHPEIINQVSNARLVFNIVAQANVEIDTLPDTVAQIHEALGSARDYAVFVFANYKDGEDGITHQVKSYCEEKGLKNVFIIPHKWTLAQIPLLNMSIIRGVLMDVLGYICSQSNGKKFPYVTSLDADVMRAFDGPGISSEFINGVEGIFYRNFDARIACGDITYAYGDPRKELLLSIQHMLRYWFVDYNGDKVKGYPSEANSTCRLGDYYIAGGYDRNLYTSTGSDAPGEGGTLYERMKDAFSHSRIYSNRRISIISSPRRIATHEVRKNFQRKLPYKVIIDLDPDTLITPDNDSPWNDWSNLGDQDRSAEFDERGYTIEEFQQGLFDIFTKYLDNYMSRRFKGQGVENIQQEYKDQTLGTVGLILVYNALTDFCNQLQFHLKHTSLEISYKQDGLINISMAVMKLFSAYMSKATFVGNYQKQIQDILNSEEYTIGSLDNLIITLRELRTLMKGYLRSPLVDMDDIFMEGQVSIVSKKAVSK